MHKQITGLCAIEKLKSSESAYAAKVTLLPKKDGNKRFCGNYHPLNMQTRKDSFPMPLISDVINQLGRSEWFSALDLQSGLWWIKMYEKDIKKTIVITKRGLYEWLVMLFGLKNVTIIFQSMI